MSIQDDKNRFDKIYGADGGALKKTPWLLVAVIALALVAVILLAVFLHSYLSVVHLSSADGGDTFLDRKNDITYLLAPLCYEPVTILTKNVYARYDDMDFYEIKNADPEKYLCYKYEDIGIYDLYYADGVQLPTLAEFEAKYALVCMTETVTAPIGYLNELTADVVDYFLAEPTVDYSLVTGVESALSLKFISEKYEFLYYSIEFYKTKTGECYLYDRSFNRCVQVTNSEYAEAILGDAE